MPDAPGVPQVPRSPDVPPPPEAISASNDATQAQLTRAAHAAAAWGVFDTSFQVALKVDSVLDFDVRNEWRISNFPIEKGSFASYNKVAVPFELSVRVAKIGTGVGDRAQFLADVSTLAKDLKLYTILTPERAYDKCNITRYEVTRRGAEGAYSLTEVDLFFVQILEVTAQYSTTQAATQNAQLPVSQPPVSRGIVQPAKPFPDITKSENWPPNAASKFTDPNTVFTQLGPGDMNALSQPPVHIGP